jgi:molecular chaperone GrpE
VMSEEHTFQEHEADPEKLTEAAEQAAPVEEDAVEPTPIEQLAEQLVIATQKAEENWDKAVRVQAEMENLRRRTEKEVQDARKFALEKFAREIVSVVDSLELGIQAAASNSPDVVKLREGSELTLKQLLAVLERFNVVPLEPLGQKFNPEQHQAMAMEPTAAAEPNTVVKVFQKGYLLNDRLLRPAMVVIAQAAAEPSHLDEKA